jgi:hypothetical protein
MDALSSKRGVAYLESSVLRKIIRPATIPGKMWIVFTVLKSLKNEASHKATEIIHSTPQVSKIALHFDAEYNLFRSQRNLYM